MLSNYLGTLFPILHFPVRKRFNILHQRRESTGKLILLAFRSSTKDKTLDAPIFENVAYCSGLNVRPFVCPSIFYYTSNIFRTLCGRILKLHIADSYVSCLIYLLCHNTNFSYMFRWRTFIFGTMITNGV